MTGPEFDVWWELAIQRHAEQVSRATAKPLAAAVDESRALLPKVLTAGLDTEGMRLFVVVDESGADVGWLWIGAAPGDPDAGFVWDIIIDEVFRGRGYGRAAMVAAEQHFAALGKTRITLQVYGGNVVARTLYESLGYAEIMTTMSKPLARGDA
jgi:ribosomal protein S18 acetylase RimI-like enzyme